MQAKIGLMGMLCLINKLLNKQKALLIITFLLYALGANAQETPQYEPLKIGEKVPDIEFAIKNYHTPTAKISDFKGKLLILDFWTTYCSTCIAGFPRMEKLQEKYGDKIQIILVNVQETEKEIEEKLNRRRSVAPELNRMPSIVGSEALKQLLPHQFAGNYFWIDTKGDLCLSSAIAYNHTDKKINDVLNGKPITFVKHDREYQKDKLSLSEIISESPEKHAEYSSLFTAVDLNYYPMGGQDLSQIDRVNNRIRNTYINRSVLQLYSFALDDFLKEEWKSKVQGPYLGTNHYLDPFLLLVKDSSLYDNRLIPKELETDVNMVKSLVCYEQILPLKYSNAKQTSEFMLNDLDRYFGLKYGAKVTIEEVLIPCYFIKKGIYPPVREEDLKKKLKYLGEREFRNIGDFGSIVGNFYRFTNGVEVKLPYVFDVDDLNKKGKTIMPAWKEGDTLEDFMLALSLNGLEYSKGERKIKMIVVRDN